jgi:hypothetical protein
MSEIRIFNPGLSPVVYTLTGLTLDPAAQTTVEPDSRTLMLISKGRLLDITDQPTNTARTSTASTTPTAGEDAN